MSVPQIGVYLADHTFFPVFPDATPGKKRIVLSTSHPDQECVDIVLFRRDPEFPAGEQRLGNVLLCDIARTTPDESEIEVVLHLHEDGHIDASARDRLSGNTRDVSFDPEEAVPRGDDLDVPDQFAAGGVDSLLDEDLPDKEETSEATGGRRRWLWVVPVLLLLAVLGFVLLRFVVPEAGGSDRTDVPEATDSNGGTGAGGDSSGTAITDGEDASDEDSRTDEDAMTDGAATDSAATDSATADDGTSTADSSPTPTQGDSAPYQIKWGDTLWDLSRMFYGTPWRFPEIADENDITDPDRIYADDQIQIPEK